MKKNAIKVSGLLVMTMILVNACEEKDNGNDDVTPVISDVVAENHDTGENQIPRGGTISVNFKAEARGDARLDYYHIEIHDHPASGQVEDEYKIVDDDFKDKDEFKGLKSTPVHQHVAVPDTANLGAYHVVITVVDDSGYASHTEALNTEIEIIE